MAADREETVLKTLDLVIEGELRLLAIYDARQGSADTRTAALATAAVALPPLILSLSKGFRSNSTLLHVSYPVVVAFAIGILLARAWNAWRKRPHVADNAWLHVSAEGIAVASARQHWRDYQSVTQVGEADPIRVRQLTLEMWRSRADDSRKVAEIKDIISVVAAILLVLALIITGILVATAHST